jgi:nucleoside-diphosphate-sugar epimerase
MHVVIVGAGFVGQRVRELIPGSTGLRRADVDLDDDSSSPLRFSEPYSILFTVPPNVTDGEDLRLARLFERLETAPGRFVYLSTTGVYGDCGGAVVSEASPVAPMNERSRARAVAENTLSQWCEDAGTECFVLRVPGIYGPGRLGLDRIRERVPIIAEKEAGPGNRIHVDDLAASAAAALTADAPPGVYNVGDGDHRSSTWFAMTVARLAGLEEPPEVSREQAEKTFGEARLSFLRESRRVDTTKMRETLGFTPRYTNPEDGIRASL